MILILLYANHHIRTHVDESQTSQSYVLRAVTSLAFASENRFQSSPEATQRLLETLNSDKVFDIDQMMDMWDTLSNQQQKSWMRLIFNQFRTVSSAVAQFSWFDEDTSYALSLSRVVSSLKQISKSAYVTLYKVSEKRENTHQKLSVIASSRSFDSSNKTPIGIGIAGIAAAESQILFVENAREDPRFVAIVDGDAPRGSSILSVPVGFNSKQKSVHWVVQFCGSNYSPESIALLEVLASHTIVLLSNHKSRAQEVYLRKKFQAMVEVAHILSSELELEPLIKLMRYSSKELLDADKCTLFLVVPEKRELWTRIEEGPEISFPMSSGISGYVASTGDTVNIPDAYKDPRFCPDVDTDTGYRTRSILCMPVKDGKGEIIGAIQMINKASGHFGEEDEELLHAFCTHAAVAIRNSRIYKQKLEEREKFQALAQIMDVISSELELDPLIPILRLKSRELLDADKCTLFIVDEENKSMRTRLAEGMDVSFPMSQGIAGYVATTGETLNIPDAYADPRFNRKFDIETGYCTRNILCMPVRSSDDGAIVGSIQMINKKKGQFGKSDEELLKAFTAHAAVAITNSRLYSEVRNTKRTLESILSSINSYVITFNMDGILTSYNRAFGHLFGVSEAEFKTKPFWALFSNPNENKLIGDMKSIYTSSNPITNTAFVIKSVKGPTFTVNYTVTHLLSHDSVDQSMWGSQRRTGLLLVIDDISYLNSMKKTISEMETEIDKLRTHVSSAFEAPIQGVIRTIQRMSQGNLPISETRQELVHCLTLLSKTDLFQPDIESMLVGVDEITRSFILQRFEHPVYRDRQAMQTWPDLDTIIDGVDPELLNWGYDCANVNEDSILAIMFNVFKHFNLISLFRIPEEKLRNFLMACRNCYRSNPFHNFHHAFAVLQAVYIILVRTRASQYISNIDIFSLVVGAIAHDLDHPGVNNGFEISTRSALAMTYNDLSVQENHHSATAFSLMFQQDSNILENLQPDELKEFRKIVVTSILATDMTQHFELTAKFKSAIATSSFSRENKESRQLLVSIILHAADLSNPVRPSEISSAWSERLREEFLSQTQKERDFGVPVTPFMLIEETHVFAKNEIGFIDFVVRPMWEAVVEFLPELSECKVNMDMNKRYWQLKTGTPSS